MACVTLVPWPGIEPWSSAVKVQSPDNWTASREFPPLPGFHPGEIKIHVQKKKKKGLYEKIHSNLIHNSPKSRNIQMFVNRWVDHHIMYIYCKEFCTAVEGMNYWYTQQDECVSKNDFDHKKPDSEEYVSYEPIYLKFWNRPSCERQ